MSAIPIEELAKRLYFKMHEDSGTSLPTAWNELLEDVRADWCGAARRAIDSIRDWENKQKEIA
jgi:hypothetical protein